MDADWDAVAQAIRHRLDELAMTMTDLAAESRVSMFTVRELVHNVSPRRRQPRTLQALSESLGWPAAYLGEVLTGHEPTPHQDEANDSVLLALAEIRRTVEAISDRVSVIEAWRARVERAAGQ